MLTFTVYIGLVGHGGLGPPNLFTFLERIAPPLSKTASTSIVIVIVAFSSLAAIGPLIYGTKSGDNFAFFFSVVALLSCAALLVGARTPTDMTLAAFVYYITAIVSLAMYWMNRVAVDPGQA